MHSPIATTARCPAGAGGEAAAVTGAAPRAATRVARPLGEAGSYASTRRCALFPPNPNADRPARRRPSHGSARRSTRNGLAATASLSGSACSVGGRTPASIAASSLSSPAAPAAVTR
nr:hypothetical protein [Sorangium cellulosum]